MIRIGFSKDIHELKEGYPLIIGGINIPTNKGSVSYADGDALVHSIIDALLGAIAYKDIGEIFKNTDPVNKGRSSISMLKVIKDLLKSKNVKINNLDCFISLEEPMLSPYKEKIVESIANTLEISVKQISVKAGTNEGFDSVGKKEAIVAYCCCLVEE